MTGMRKGILAVLLIATLLPVVEGKSHGKVYLTLEEALELAFPEADRIVNKKVFLDKEARVAIGKVARQEITDLSFQFYVGMIGERILGYMAIDDVIGQAEPITYMIVFTPEGSVKCIEVMTYREPQGDEVRYPGFLRQYQGKTLPDPLRAGQDIRIISGATLSSSSLTAGVKKMLAVFKHSFLGGLP